MEEQKKQASFDGTQKFGIRIQSGGEKRCVVRFPADAEWCDHTRAQVSVRRTMGRGRSTMESAGAEKADAELFAAIRADEAAVEFDAADAGAVIEKLQRAEVEDSAREGDVFRIKLRVLGGVLTEHVLRMPTQKQMQEYGRASTRWVSARRAQEIRTFLEPSGALYDKLSVTVSGYAGAPSIAHKAAAVNELLSQLAELDEDAELPEASAL